MTEELDLQDLRERLAAADVFRNLADPDLEAVLATGEVRTVKAGDVLGVHGERGSELFTVLEGELRLLAGNGRHDVAIRVAGPGETVPLAALIDPPVLVTTIEAGTDGRVFAMSRPRLLAVLEERPAVGMRVFRAAATVLERRYSSTLDGLVGSLRSVLEIARSATPPPEEAGAGADRAGASG